MAQVEIYTRSWCSFCQSTKALLKRKGVSFIEYDVEEDPERLPEMLQRANGRRTVPQVFVGATHVGGNDDLQALERAGKLDGLLAG